MPTSLRYLTPTQVATMQATMRDQMQMRGLTCADLSRLSPAPLSSSAIAPALRVPTCTTMLAGRIAHALGLEMRELVGSPDPPAPCAGEEREARPDVRVVDDTPPWRLLISDLDATILIQLFTPGSPYEPVLQLYGEAQVRALTTALQDALMEHAYQMGIAEGKRSSFSLAP